MTMTFDFQARLMLILLLLSLGMSVRAGDTDPPETEAVTDTQPWSGSLEAWAYATHTRPIADSPVNPRNQIVRIPGRQLQAEARLNVRGDFEPFDLLADARLYAEHSTLSRGSVIGAQDRTNDLTQARLIQGFGRWKTGSSTWVLGREVLAWGPSTFRSPSNPFYFDAGLTQPLAVTPGIDLVRLTHGLNDWRITVAHVGATDRLEPKVDRAQTTLLKLDHQGQNHFFSVNVAAKEHRKAFAGGFVQYSPDDAWLLYAEHGSANQAAGLGRSSLGGGSYTFTGGQIMSTEWLHHAGGWQKLQSHQFFDQAAQAIAAGAALGNVVAPRLMGRNYLWLSLQSNPQDTQLLWRTELTRNQTDNSNRWMLYVEKSLSPRVSGFFLLRGYSGGRFTEYGSLISTSATVGIKLFAF